MNGAPAAVTRPEIALPVERPSLIKVSGLTRRFGEAGKSTAFQILVCRRE